MSIKKGHLRDLVNWVLDESDWYSESALELILGTIAQESHRGKYLRQLGSGPAKGIIQMEPNTERDIWHNYLTFNPHIRHKLTVVSGVEQPSELHLEGNLIYQILMCRVHYLRVKEALPVASDIEALGKYWKKYYNTVHGAGTVEEFVDNYNKYIV